MSTFFVLFSVNFCELTLSSIFDVKYRLVNYAHIMKRVLNLVSMKFATCKNEFGKNSNDWYNDLLTMWISFILKPGLFTKMCYLIYLTNHIVLMFNWPLMLFVVYIFHLCYRIHVIYFLFESIPMFSVFDKALINILVFNIFITEINKTYFNRQINIIILTTPFFHNII